MFSKTRPLRSVDVWPRNGRIGVKCLSQGFEDPISGSKVESRVYSLAIANLRSYPLSCTTAIIVILALSLIRPTNKMFQIFTFFN